MNNNDKKKNEKKNKTGNMGGLCGQISGYVKRSVKPLYFVLFIHHCKTVIKADQKSSFYPSINDILYQKYLKKRQCHCDNVALSEATETNKQTNKKRVYRILKYIRSAVLLFAFPVYIRSVVNNDFFASQPCTTEYTARFSQRRYSDSSQTCICLAVILMYLFNFLDGLY